jgi:hypothetical protein
VIRAGVFENSLLLGAVGWPAPASAEDAPPPPPGAPLERLFAPLKEQFKGLPPFLGDTDLKVHFRSYYFNRTKPDDTKNEAEAFGGWISYQSGWLVDTFAMGASLYGSAPLYAPDDRDGTSLLKPGQEGYYVPGEAWGALRYQDYALLKGYRQLVDQSYINPQDNRMTPNTFEALTLGGKVGWVQPRLGRGRHQPVHPKDGAQPGGVRLHDRLSAPVQGPCPPGHVVPRPRGYPRPARCQDARVPVPHHHQLGQGPDLMHLL